MQKGARVRNGSRALLVVIARLLLTLPIKGSGLGRRNYRVLRFIINQETESSSAHHSEFEFVVNARSRCKGRRQVIEVGRETRIETAAIRLNVGGCSNVNPRTVTTPMFGDPASPSCELNTLTSAHKAAATGIVGAWSGDVDNSES